MFFVGFFFTSADILYQSFLTLIQFWFFLQNFGIFWKILLSWELWNIYIKWNKKIYL